MLYAKVVLGIPVEGPFDYIVPANLYRKINVGVRVKVSFRNQRLVGYIVRLSRRTKIKNIKPILELFDETPILDKNMLLLTKRLSEFYCCSWGEAIETALPQSLREGRKPSNLETFQGQLPRSICSPNYNLQETLIHDLDGRARWEIYLREIKQILDKNGSAILLLPEINSVFKAKEIITNGLGIPPTLLYRRHAKELQEWLKIKAGKASIVLGTRSAIFAPLNNLGLIIIDEEQDTVYKQEQVPHYNAREVAFMRTHIEKAKLILGSSSPSLEIFRLVKQNKIKYISIPREKSFPEIKIINTTSMYHRQGGGNMLSGYLYDVVSSVLSGGGKVLLFLNRRGFATSVYCSHCGTVLKCPRCSINLVYHFKEGALNCHYCNFKMPPPQICPICNSGYIRYAGTGTEKIESELSRLFPQAKINRLDSRQNTGIKDADMFIATKSIIAEANYDFDLIGVLLIDNSLNRIDFRSSEKTFGLLVGLTGLTAKKIIIQTGLPNHYCFQALLNKDINIFYDEELKQRKQLSFPPFKHIGLIKLRSKSESRVKQVSDVLFKKLKKYNKDKTIEIASVNPAQPSKLRGNFCWQVLIKASSGYKITKFLKINLKKISHSGIIVTVDIAPL